MNRRISPRTAKLVAALATFTLALVLGGWLLLSGLTGALAGRQAAATSVTVPTTLPATTTSTPGVVPTGSGPSAFTTTSAAGPIQVLVVGARCAGYAGDGWQVTYRVENHGASAHDGSLLGQIDETGEPTVLAPAVHLAARQTMTATQVVKGSGESVMVTWAEPVLRVRSFPVEVPACPQDPADLRQAQQPTTTT